MKNAAVPLSIRLPDSANKLLDGIISKLHITKSQFLRNAVIAKIEDELDIQAIEDVLSLNEKTYSFDEVKREFGLED